MFKKRRVQINEGRGTSRIEGFQCLGVMSIVAELVKNTSAQYQTMSSVLHQVARTN